jgi:hypothetical protein
MSAFGDKASRFALHMSALTQADVLYHGGSLLLLELLKELLLCLKVG